MQYTKNETFNTALDDYTSGIFRDLYIKSLQPSLLSLYLTCQMRYLSFKNKIIQENNSFLKEKQYSKRNLKFSIGIQELPIYVGIPISIRLDTIRQGIFISHRKNTCMKCRSPMGYNIFIGLLKVLQVCQYSQQENQFFYWSYHFPIG